MKQFIIKVLCFVLITGSILIGYNKLYNHFRADDQYGDGKFIGVPYNINISNTGSSHGVYAFDYSDYKDEITGFNFALISQTLSYDYRVIRNYEAHFSDNGIMFIPVSYPSFSVDETELEDFESKNQRYYRFLKPGFIKELDWNTYIGLHFFPAIYESTSDVIRIFLKGITGQHPVIEDTYDLGNPDFDFAEDAVRAYKRHIRTTEDGHLNIEQEEVDALYDIIAFCKEKNIRPIMISTPLRGEYREQYDETVLDDFYALIAEVQSRSGCEYYDYSCDERFAHSDQYMRNSDHLSPDGAKAFTEIVMSEILGGRY